MNLVSHILQRKGNDVYSISPDAIMFEALKLMAEKEVGALLVMQENKVVGILSERDYARKVFLKGKSSKDAPVKEIMQDRVLFVNPAQSVEDCMALMSEKRIRHLPVMEEEKLVGLISIGDVVKAVISEREFMIDQLVQYIAGTH